MDGQPTRDGTRFPISHEALRRVGQASFRQSEGGALFGFDTIVSMAPCLYGTA